MYRDGSGAVVTRVELVDCRLSGAVLTETVFSWPGLGSYLVHAVQTNDYGVVQGAMLLVATIFAASNLLLDIVYAWLDPRIRGAAA